MLAVHRANLFGSFEEGERPWPRRRGKPAFAPQHLGDRRGSREPRFGDADDGCLSAKGLVKVSAQAGFFVSEVDVAVNQQDLRQGPEPVEHAEDAGQLAPVELAGAVGLTSVTSSVHSARGAPAVHSMKVRHAARAPSGR